MEAEAHAPGSVEPSSPVPLYFQIANVLQARIFSGRYAPGTRLGPGHELAREFHVSGLTIRKALAVLQKDNLIETRRGLGTFVATAARPVAPTALNVFLDDILSRTEVLTTAYVEQDEVDAPLAVAEALGIAAGTSVVRVQRRVGYGVTPDGVWVVYFLPPDVWQRIRPADLRRDTLLRLIDDAPGLRLAGGLQTVHAVAADHETATRLGVAPGAAILRVERLYRTDSGRTVVYGWADYTHSSIPVLLSRARR